MRDVFYNMKHLSTDEIKKMLIINGTAILYPYLRSIVSNITSIDTEGNTIIMPVVDLSDLLNKENEDEDEGSE